ncbi:MAG TPA: DUF2946 family protein [Methylocella sp.]|jgi:hypothetical protein
MGRRGLGGILVGLALLAQLLVPVAAARIYAQATDPFGHILICAPDAVPGADNSAPDNQSPHHNHCPLCQIAVAGSLLLGARSVGIPASYSDASPILWTTPADGPPIFGMDRRKPPRGPPSLI